MVVEVIREVITNLWLLGIVGAQLFQYLLKLKSDHLRPNDSIGITYKMKRGFHRGWVKRVGKTTSRLALRFNLPLRTHHRRRLHADESNQRSGKRMWVRDQQSKRRGQSSQSSRQESRKQKVKSHLLHSSKTPSLVSVVLHIPITCWVSVFFGVWNFSWNQTSELLRERKESA